MRILSSRIVFKDIFVTQKICDYRLGHDLPIYVNDSNFSISQGFYFHETLHM